MSSEWKELNEIKIMMKQKAFFIIFEVISLLKSRKTEDIQALKTKGFDTRIGFSILIMWNSTLGESEEVVTETFIIEQELT